MLQPTHRLTLIDAMRPPPGYRFDVAMAVTFTLDLRALLAAPAAFALAATEDGDPQDPHAEPIELLHAIRSHAGHLTVFSQAGEIALPPSRRVFAFLEGSVVPVTAPRGGVVHPKVWVLRYVNDDNGEPIQLRVLSASRNLTFDTSWDTVLRLDSTPDGSGVHANPVAELFEALVQNAVGRVADSHQERVAQVCTDLRDRRFALPAGVDDLRVHLLGLRRGAASPLPARADRSLVISPFVSDDFFSRIHPSPIDELVSRPESLDDLKPASLRSVGTAYAFDDGSAPDLVPDESRAARDPAQPLRGVHAKVFAFEVGDRAHVFSGSANATGAAFSRNVEVLFELEGARGRLGIDRLCAGSDDELGLRALFHTYVHSVPPTSDPVEVTLDGVRHAIAGTAIVGRVEASGADWAITYSSTGNVELADGVELFCWPLATTGNRRAAPSGQPLSVRFEVSLDAISGFLAFEAVHRDSSLVTQFVVPAALEGVPEHRDSYLLRSMIGSADRFLRYLLALLADDSTELDLQQTVDAVAGDGSVPGGAASSLPVLEAMLRSLRRDPAKLLAADPLISDLGDEDVLPPGFAELWQGLRTVATAPRNIEP